VPGGQAVFVDFLAARHRVTVDLHRRETTAVARIDFDQKRVGFPAFDLLPEVSEVIVDGKVVPATALCTGQAPDGTALRYLEQALSRGRHTLELHYKLDGVTYNDNTVEFRTQLRDLKSRNYFERYFPSNFLHDQHPTELTLRILGRSSNQRLFTNGAVEVDGDFTTISFPKHYNASSPYIHLVDEASVTVREDVYAGQEGPIPITVYSEDAAAAAEGLARAKEHLAEFETTYGPYAHPAFLAYIVDDKKGGMEYAGATRTEMWGLKHEVLHSWFGRGVMPASGNDGWIDEAIASWMDNGYPRAERFDPSGISTPLAGGSPYRRDTERAAYKDGAQVMAELDRAFADQGGLRPLLGEFYRKYVNRTVTTHMLQEFLSRRTKIPLDAFFRNRVYGLRPEASAGGV
jgi:hypothetical protein